MPRGATVLSLLVLGACSAEQTSAPVVPEGIVAGQIAFVRGSGASSQIFLINSDGSGLVRLTNDASLKSKPSWSPDGTKIAYAATNNGAWAIYVMNADGSGLVPLTHDGVNREDPAWSPDGAMIAFSGSTGGISIMNADGSGITTVLPQALADSSFVHDFAPAWSPDGSTIAFVRESFSPEGVTTGSIYIMRADGSGLPAFPPGLPLANAVGEADPAWSPSGHSLLFARILPSNPATGSFQGPALTLLGTDGTVLSQNLANIPASNPSWSPDGGWIAFNSDWAGQIYVMHADGSGVMALTAGGVDSRPSWRPRR